MLSNEISFVLSNWQFVPFGEGFISMCPEADRLCTLAFYFSLS